MTLTTAQLAEAQRAWDMVPASFSHPAPDAPMFVSLGMGLDSITMLALMHRYGIRPDAILFADTRSEKHETYLTVPVVSAWLERLGFPQITIVTKRPPLAPYQSLWGYCAAGDTLPSLAFTGGPMGAGQCSTAWKIEPQVEWIKHWQPALDAWAEGQLVTSVVGYDAGDADTRRACSATAKTYPEGTNKWFPLRDAGWTRRECKAVIRAELGAELLLAIGQDTPMKSACFMCPATTREEVIWLAKHSWDLALRGLAIEFRARYGRIEFGREGLGISWSWLELLTEHDLLPADWLQQAIDLGYVPAEWDDYVARLNASRPQDERPLAKVAEKPHKLRKGKKKPGKNKQGPIWHWQQAGPVYRWDPKRKAAMKAERQAWLKKTHPPDWGMVPEPAHNVESVLGLAFEQIGKAKSFHAATTQGRRLPLAQTA